ncbi:MAG: hypothetical protein NTX50_24985 [Candidatus Sumerlaeota bacterium]|nr:hypothetical protein [Candidatus Sumerlaeota bacterium]
MAPDQSILVSGGKTDGSILNLAARHKDGKWLMVYLADKAAFSIDMGKLAGSDRGGAAFWIDPRTGRQTPTGSSSSRGVQNFTTPEGWEDTLLIVEPAGAAGANKDIEK